MGDLFLAQTGDAFAGILCLDFGLPEGEWGTVVPALPRFARVSACRPQELECERDALLELYAGTVPEAWTGSTGRITVCRMLPLEITPQEDESLSVRGDLQVRNESGGPGYDLDFVPTERHLPLGRIVRAFSHQLFAFSEG